MTDQRLRFAAVHPQRVLRRPAGLAQ